MSLRVALIVLQALTIVARIYTLRWYSTDRRKYTVARKCPGSHKIDGVSELDRMEEKTEGHV
jgi:hypothetical protein